jgi:hypothetical protein
MRLSVKTRYLFWPVYVLMMLGATLLGAEAVSSFLVPTWPARDLRPIPADLLQRNLAEASGDRPDLVPVFNDWAVRDRPRTFARPLDVKFRSVLVGDSFLEGFFVPAPLSAFVERRWASAGLSDMEAINFGVSATGPRQYFYRIRDVALALKPDAIVLAVYAGNDFISTPFGGTLLPPLIDELPIPSILGEVAPRTTWLAVNRLGLSEVGRVNRGTGGEFALLNGYLALPPAERLDRIVAHMKQHYFPRLGDETIREILSRGGDRFWAAFGKRQADPEFLAGWMLSGLIDWETGQWKMPRDAEEADRLHGQRMVDETLSWLVAADRLAKENGVPLIMALLPAGTVDPAYVAFWRPWPKYFSASLSADARHRRLAVALRQQGLPFIDLRDDLEGIAGTYRLSDGHWNERGSEIVARRLARELLKLRKN